MTPFASCCLLSYNRAQFVEEAILTLTGNTNLQLELIVHDDGSTDLEVQEVLRRFVDAGAISTLIQNPPGHNQGVGEATRRMFEVAQGDVLIKLDQDLIFMPGWLETVVDVLHRNRYEHQPLVSDPNALEPRIGALGFFKYHADPVDHAKMFRKSWAYWHEVQDFVGSAIAIPRDVYEEFGPFPTHSTAFAEDVQFKTDLQKAGLALGLTTEDLVHNQGFGLGPSTVAVPGEDGSPTSAKIHDQPKLIGPS
jgi:glycosyltransferase involved in cell wall biosynthesis